MWKVSSAAEPRWERSSEIVSARRIWAKEGGRGKAFVCQCVCQKRDGWVQTVRIWRMGKWYVEMSDTNRDASASSVGGRALLSCVRVLCSVATLELPCEFVSAEQTPTLHGINSKHHTACYFTCAHVYEPSNSGSNSMAWQLERSPLMWSDPLQDAEFLLLTRWPADSHISLLYQFTNHSLLW